MSAMSWVNTFRQYAPLARRFERYTAQGATYEIGKRTIKNVMALAGRKRKARGPGRVKRQARALIALPRNPFIKRKKRRFLTKKSYRKMKRKYPWLANNPRTRTFKMYYTKVHEQDGAIVAGSNDEHQFTNQIFHPCVGSAFTPAEYTAHIDGKWATYRVTHIRYRVEFELFEEPTNKGKLHFVCRNQKDGTASSQDLTSHLHNKNAHIFHWDWEKSTKRTFKFEWGCTPTKVRPGNDPTEDDWYALIAAAPTNLVYSTFNIVQQDPDNPLTSYYALADKMSLWKFNVTVKGVLKVPTELNYG